MEDKVKKKKHGLIAFIVVIAVVAAASAAVFFSSYARGVVTSLYEKFINFVNYDETVKRVEEDDAFAESYSAQPRETGGVRAIRITVPERDMREVKDGAYADYALPLLNVQLDYAVNSGYTHVLYKTSLFSDKDYDVAGYLREQVSGMGMKLILETDALLLNNENDEAAFAAARFTPEYKTVRGGFLQRLLYPSSSSRKVVTYGIDPEWIYIADDGARRLNPSYDGARDFVVGEVRRAVEKYAPDMLLLDTPIYNVRNLSEQSAFKRFPGMTGEELHHRCTKLLTASISGMMHEAAPDVLFGIRADRVWKTLAADARGIDINSSYSDYGKGCADTLEWCEKGYVDFVVIDNRSSMLENNDFMIALDWWKNVESRTGVKLICGYDANMINTTPEWSGYYELANQYDYAAKADCADGVFEDYDALAEHSEEAELLYMVFNNTIDFGIADEELTLTSPADNVTVDVPTVAVSGTCDNNFDIMVNGRKIEPTERGFFATDIELSAGKNTITVEHKGKKILRTVNYNIVIIKDVAPTGQITVTGGSRVEYTVTARSGAKVTGSLNGETVRFTEQSLPYEAAGSSNLFASFVGYFTAPESGEEQYSIGSARITASYGDFVKSLTGASVVVQPLPPTVGKIAVVKAAKAESFRAEPANSDTSLPQYFWLPKGTRDYITGESEYNGDGVTKKYYTLRCGLRVYQSDVDVEEGELPINETSGVTVTDSGKYTYLTFANSQKVPYKLVMHGLFPSGNDSATTASSGGFSRLDFVICGTDKKASVSGSSPLMSFTSASANAEAHTVTYSFTLNKNGGFYGFTSYFDDNGKLVIRLRNPIRAAGGRLDGISICLDPGHGGNDVGARGLDRSIYEANENLKVALALRAELESLGATVYMTRTNNQYYVDGTPITSSTLRPKRLELIDSFGVDILISVHHNYSPASSGNGTEALYFYGFNQKLAQTLSDSMAEVSGMKNRGGKYQNVFVYRNHDFMSVLLECGFLSNPSDSQWLTTEGNTVKLAKAIASGVVEYFSK